MVKSTDFFEYFVCDRVDYSALTNLKKSLNKHGRRVISSMHVQTVFPQSIIKALLALCACDFPPYQMKQSLLNSKNQNSVNENKDLHKTSGSDVTEYQFLQLNKECQTTTEIGHDSVRALDKDACFVASDGHTLSNSMSLIGDKEFSKLEYTDNCNNKFRTVETSAPSVNHHVDSLAVSDQVIAAIASKHLLDKEKELQKQEEEQLKAQCNISKVNLECFYVCKLCSHKSKSDKLMLRHLRSHNNGHPFECPACVFSTIWRQEWKQHLQRKHGEQKILCQFCAAEFSRKNVFEQHVMSAHPGT